MCFLHRALSQARGCHFRRTSTSGTFFCVGYGANVINADVLANMTTSDSGTTYIPGKASRSSADPT